MLCLDDIGRRHGGSPKGADLARSHQIGKRRQDHFDIGVGRHAVNLIKIDVIGTKTPQRALDRFHDPATRTALLVGIRPHRTGELGRKHDPIAPTPKRGADDFLGPAIAVAIGCVDHVDAAVQSLVDDADTRTFVGIGHFAEHHGPQAIRADLDAGASKWSVLHGHISASSLARGSVEL